MSESRIPDSFREDALRLGYRWDNPALHAEWEEHRQAVFKLASEIGCTRVSLRDRGITGCFRGRMIMLADASDTGDDPLNLWAHAFQVLDGLRDPAWAEAHVGTLHDAFRASVSDVP